MTEVFAIDPGTEQSGWVRYLDGRVLGCGVLQNDEMLKMVKRFGGANKYDTVLTVEMVASYGMAVGREVFETCVWIGRYVQAWHSPNSVRMVYRKDVKLHICGNGSAKDSNIRKAILDLFPRTGGGAVPQVGLAKKPGPLWGVTTHVWPALGVAIYTAHELGRAPTPRTRRARLL